MTQLPFKSATELAAAVRGKEVCPNGNWTMILTSLTYNDVTLHIQQPPGTDVLVDNLGTIDP